MQAPDLVNPTGTITAPLSGEAVTTTNAFTVTGTANDADSGIDEVRVRIQRRDITPFQYWNGTSYQTGSTFLQATINPDGTWQLPGVDLTTPGTYRVTLQITDNAGNLAQPWTLPGHTFTTEAPVTDVVNPTGTITAPLSGEAVTTTNAFTVTGTANDADSGIDEVRVRIQRRDITPFQYWNGTSYQTGSTFLQATINPDGTWQLPGVDLTTPGTYRVTLQITDNAGNLAQPWTLPGHTFTVS